MKVSISELLGKKHPIGAAERTFTLVKAAVAEGNLRLAVSRGITVVIMATAAAMKAPAVIVRRAEDLIQATRDIIHGAVIKRVALSGLGVRYPRSVDPDEEYYKKLTREAKQELEKKFEERTGLTKEEVEKLLPPELRSKKKKKKESEVEIPKDFPFAISRFPGAEFSKFHGSAQAGVFIPTPGDEYGVRLTTLLPLKSKTMEHIEPQPDGIKVYGPEAVRDVLEQMVFLYSTMPDERGIFIPTPGDPGGVELLAKLSSQVDPTIPGRIESHPGGLRVRGQWMTEAVSNAMTRIRGSLPRTWKLTVLGGLPWGA